MKGLQTAPYASRTVTPGDLFAARLCGRDAELGALAVALAHRPAIVLVEGEAGVGKTRLVQEHLARGRPNTRSTLVAACPAVHAPLSLAPIVDGLRRIIGRGDVPNGPLAGALRPLFPEWCDRLPPAPDPAEDPATARQRIITATIDLLDTAGVRLLVLEDAHWADALTLDLLLVFAARGFRATSLVVTYRPEDLADASPLRRLSRYACGTDGAMLELRPLDPAGTSAMVSSMLAGARVSPELAAYIHDRTEGLPLAVDESVRVIAERGDALLRDGTWVRRPGRALAISPTLRDLVLERAGRLAPEARAVLDAVALLGAPADERLVARVCALRADQVSAGLAAASRTGLLDGERGLVRFRHALAAEALASAIPPPVAAQLHRRAAQALETPEGVEADGPPPVERLIRHHRDAGDVAAWSRYAELAVDRAAGTGDEATAEAALLELLTCPALPANAVSRLVGRLRFVATDGAARYDAIESALRTILDRQGLSRAVRAEVRCRLGNLLMMSYDYDAGMRELALAAPDLGHAGSLQRWAMTLLGCPFGSTWPASTHVHWLRRAEELADGASADGAGAVVQGDDWNFEALAALALLTLGEPTAWDRALSIPNEPPSPQRRLQTARNNLNIGHIAIFWGQYAEAGRRLDVAGRLAADHAYDRTARAVALARLHLAWFTGRWDGLADQARSLASDPDIAELARLEAALVAGLHAAATGRPADAESQCRRVGAEAMPRGQLDLAVEAAAGLGRVLVAEGRPTEAVDAMRPSVDILTTKETWIWASDLAPVWVEALLATGRRDEATGFVDRFASAGLPPAARAAHAAVLDCTARLDEARGDRDAAARCFDRAAAAWLELPRPYDGWLAAARAARCRRDSDAEAVALRHLAKLGATADARRVVVSELRPGRRGGRPGYGDRLSPRERDVVRLVVEGRTDREIATLLELSPRTVSCHVAAARRKLDAPTRTGLAVRALETGALDGP